MLSLSTPFFLYFPFGDKLFQIMIPYLKAFNLEFLIVFFTLFNVLIILFIIFLLLISYEHYSYDLHGSLFQFPPFMITITFIFLSLLIYKLTGDIKFSLYLSVLVLCFVATIDLILYVANHRPKLIEPWHEDPYYVRTPYVFLRSLKYLFYTPRGPQLFFIN